MSRRRKRTSCCLCCKKGPLSLSVQLDRSAYVSGESLRLKADIHNRSAEDVRLRLRLIQVHCTSWKTPHQIVRTIIPAGSLHKSGFLS